MKTIITIDLVCATSPCPMIEIEVDYHITKGQPEIINPPEKCQPEEPPEIKVDSWKLVDDEGDMQQEIQNYMNDNFADFDQEDG